MVTNRSVQWILVNDDPFTCISIFSDSQPTFKSLSSFVNNSRIVKPLSWLYFWALHQWITRMGPEALPDSGELQGGRTPGLLYSFWNPLRLNWVCHLPRSSWPLCWNSFWTPTSPKLMRSVAPPLDWTGSWWIERVPINWLNLSVASCQLRWTCLRVIALWVSTQKNEVPI